MNVLSLCDGISCGQVALKRAGFKIDKYFASEINKHSIEVAMFNHPETIQIGDLTKINEDFLKTLPKIDIILAGTPCQDLSLAGTYGKLRNGERLRGNRSGLFFNFIDILYWIRENNNKEVKFLLENVKSNTESIEEISSLCGVEPVIINSNLVSAQNRIRYYWTNIGEISQPEDKKIFIKDVVYDNDYGHFKDPRIEATKTFSKNYVKWDISGKGYNSQQNRAYFLEGKMCCVPKNRAKDKLNIWLGEDLYREGHPIEAERYQTLPDNYTSCIKSINKRMELVGDGWTIDVIVHILNHLEKPKQEELVW